MAGPAGIHYSSSTQPVLSGSGWGGNCVLVVNAFASRRWAARMQEFRAADVEVLEYTLPTHDYSGTASDAEEWVSFYTGGSGSSYNRSNVPSSWYWDPATPDRVYVGAYSGRVMDMREGSAWLNHCLDWYEARMASSSWRMDGWFIDVFGDDYLGMISGFGSGEDAEFRAGVVWFANKLRERLGDEVILVANNTWQTNMPLNGLCLENHSTPGAYYDAQLARAQAPLGRRRNMTISSSVGLVETWAAVPGVDHAAKHDSDGYMIAPSPPFGGVEAGSWPPEAGHIHLWDSTTALPGDGGGGGPVSGEYTPDDFPVADIFDRADQTPPGGPWRNFGPWGTSNGLRVVSNRLAIIATGGWQDDMLAESFDRSEGPVVAGVELDATPAVQFVWLSDGTGGGSGYALRFEPGQNVRVIRYDEGVDAEDVIAVAPVALGATDALAVVAEPGGAITAWVRLGGGWEVLGEGNDSTYTVLHPGWETTSTTQRVKTFWGGLIEVAPPPVEGSSRGVVGIPSAGVGRSSITGVAIPGSGR